jgi:hypothetical protein
MTLVGLPRFALLEAQLIVQIDRFVDEHFPGFVECSLIDVSGEKHVFVDKVPIFTVENLTASSQYPRPGVIACVIHREWRAEDGSLLTEVSTLQPWGIESSDGKSSFVVLASQLSPNTLAGKS